MKQYKYTGNGYDQGKAAKERIEFDEVESHHKIKIREVRKKFEEEKSSLESELSLLRVEIELAKEELANLNSKINPSKGKFGHIVDNHSMKRKLISESDLMRRDKATKQARKQREKNPIAYQARVTINAIRSPHDSLIKYGEKQLGYTKKQFTKHIESLFEKGMSWENAGVWEIDHITPVYSLVEKGVTDVRVINALSNLRPLWNWEHAEKTAKETTSRARNKSTNPLNR